jgi:hypothetical protein
VRAIDAAGEDAVADALRGWLAGRRSDDGGYRIENVFRFLVTSAPG